MSDMSKIELAERQLAYLNQVMERTGWIPAALSRHAKIHPSTLTNFFKRKREDHTLTDATIRKIELASQIAFDGRPMAAPFPKAQTSDDGETFTPSHAPDFAAMIEAFCTGNEGATAVTLRTSGLVQAGYASGDVLLCDPRVKPAEGDLVIAMSGSDDAVRKRMVIRLWHQPYLVSTGSDPRSRWPIVVDNFSTRITATVVGSVRSRNRA